MFYYLPIVLMKKFLSLTLLSSLVILFWCTNTGTNSPSQDAVEIATTQAYENKIENFAIQFPSTREFQENVYWSHVTFFTPLEENDTLRENISITKKELDQNYSLEEQYILTKPELENLIPNFLEISKENITINGIDAHKLIYQWTQSTYKLQWQQIYLIKDNAIYIATYTATQDSFWEFVQDVDAMVNTLEIK